MKLLSTILTLSFLSLSMVACKGYNVAEIEASEAASKEAETAQKVEECKLLLKEVEELSEASEEGKTLKQNQ